MSLWSWASPGRHESPCMGRGHCVTSAPPHTQACGTWDGRVLLWDLRAGQMVNQWEAHAERVSEIEHAPRMLLATHAYMASCGGAPHARMRPPPTRPGLRTPLTACTARCGRFAWTSTGSCRQRWTATSACAPSCRGRTASRRGAVTGCKEERQRRRRGARGERRVPGRTVGRTVTASCTVPSRPCLCGLRLCGWPVRLACAADWHVRFNREGKRGGDCRLTQAVGQL